MLLIVWKYSTILLEGWEVSPWIREGSETKNQGTGGTNLTMSRSEKFGNVGGAVHRSGVRGWLRVIADVITELGYGGMSFSITRFI
jgi:hypothetical protein